MALKPKQLITLAVLRVGKSIISQEHEFYIASDSDDTEHIPKVRRIVESIKQEVIELGLTRAEANGLSQELRDFAKSLFLECWMENIDEFEEQNEVWLEGAEEFDSIYDYYR